METDTEILQRVKQAWEALPRGTKGQKGIVVGFNSTTRDVNVLPFDTNPNKMAERVGSIAAFLELTDSDSYVVSFEVVCKKAENRDEAGVRPSDDEDGPVDGILFIVNMGVDKVSTYLMKIETEGTVFTVPNPESPLLRSYANLAVGNPVRDEATRLFSMATPEDRAAIIERCVIREEYRSH